MSRGGWWGGLIGVGLSLVGVWGTWVPHRAAALVLSSWDLAEYVKFVPEVSATRELFYLPAWCAGIALAIMAKHHTNKLTEDRIENATQRPNLLRRTGPVLVALVLMVAILPPYPHLLNGYRSAEFRWRFILGVCGAALVLLSWFIARWPQRTVGVLLVALALLGAVPALWQFLKVRDAIETVYGANLGWGWGLGLFLIGWGLVSVTGGRLLIVQSKSRS